MTAQDLFNRPAWRLALAVGCVVLPFFIYGLAISYIAGQLATPGPLDLKAVGIAFADRSGALFAQEMGARERFLLTSTLMLAVSLVALAYALGLILRRRGRVVGAAAALGALAVGALAAATSGNPMRKLTVHDPLALAAEAEATWGIADLSANFDVFVSVNTFFGLAAVFALMLRFGDLAAGLKADEITPAGVEERSAALRQTLLVASALLTSATVATYFYYHYPLALMTPASFEIFQPLSGVASIRWGATYTIILATAAAPAIAAFYEEQRQAKQSGVLADAPAAPKWLSAEALSKKAKILAAVMGVLAPAIAAPIMEFLKLAGG